MAYEGERYGLEVECEYMDCHTRMVLNEEGDYVQHFDYAKLETELSDTRKALERLRNNAQHIFDKKPVRDWAETLAEVDAVLNNGGKG